MHHLLTETLSRVMIDQIIEVKQYDQLSLTTIAQVVYDQQNVCQEIRTILEQYNFQPIDRHTFGELAKMTSEEMKYLDLFWDPAFNKGWLYLSDTMIKDQLTNDKGKNAISRFYENVLLTREYKSGVDYKRIDQYDPLVDLYTKSASSYNEEAKISVKATNKLYYAVSGETYIDLLTRASTDGGKLARATFRKVAYAARMMFEYINVMHAVMAEKITTETKLMLADAEKRAIKLEKEKRGPKEYPDEWFYFATCEMMTRSRAYKFGIVTKQDTPTKRLTTYDCGYTEYCALDYVMCIKSKCARSVESAFREIVRPYLKAPRQDVVLLTFAQCKKIALDLLRVTNSSIYDLLQMEIEFRMLGDEPPPVFVRGEDNLIKFEGMEPIPKPAIPPCDKCGKIYVRASCREVHVEKCEGKKESKRRDNAVLKINVATDSTSGTFPIIVHSGPKVDEMNKLIK